MNIFSGHTRARLLSLPASNSLNLRQNISLVLKIELRTGKAEPQLMTDTLDTSGNKLMIHGIRTLFETIVGNCHVYGNSNDVQ